MPPRSRREACKQGCSVSDSQGPELPLPPVRHPHRVSDPRAPSCPCYILSHLPGGDPGTGLGSQGLELPLPHKRHRTSPRGRPVVSDPRAPSCPCHEEARREGITRSRDVSDPRAPSCPCHLDYPACPQTPSSSRIPGPRAALATSLLSATPPTPARSRIPGPRAALATSTYTCSTFGRSLQVSDPRAPSCPCHTFASAGIHRRDALSRIPGPRAALATASRSASGRCGSSLSRIPGPRAALATARTPGPRAALATAAMAAASFAMRSSRIPGPRAALATRSSPRGSQGPELPLPPPSSRRRWIMADRSRIPGPRAALATPEHRRKSIPHPLVSDPRAPSCPCHPPAVFTIIPTGYLPCRERCRALLLFRASRASRAPIATLGQLRHH